VRRYGWCTPLSGNSSGANHGEDRPHGRAHRSSRFDPGIEIQKDY
jgi:hypothetical protein